MINHNIKNVSASVKARLLKIAKNTQRRFDELLQYYGIERFLYRLAISKYKNIFILKGALLLKVWDIADARATRDIDTLARTSNSLENIIKIIKEICEISSSVEDGIDFISSIKGEKMQLQKEYEGIRIQFEGYMESTRIPIQIDIGFGDIVTPCAKESQYPNILDFPGPRIKMYPQETLLAEKILTMIEKGDANSRIKDFYDVWLLFRQKQFSYDVLKLALKRTADARKMKYDFEIIRTTIERYSKNYQTEIWWKNFKRKIPEIYQDLSFDVLVAEIVDGLINIEKTKEGKLSLILQGMIHGKLKGEILYKILLKAFLKEKKLNELNINGHELLQLLIDKALLKKQKKLELIKKVIDYGVKIDNKDKSGLTPFQVAIKNRDKEIADFLLSKGACDKVPTNMNANYYQLYLRFPKA
jgi:hypothetical protein